MGYTVTEFAAAWGVDKDRARGLLQFLLVLGCAKERGKRPPQAGRGRPEAIYSLSEGYADELARFLAAHPLPP